LQAVLQTSDINDSTPGCAASGMHSHAAHGNEKFWLGVSNLHKSAFTSVPSHVTSFIFFTFPVVNLSDRIARYDFAKESSSLHKQGFVVWQKFTTIEFQLVWEGYH
jgi:uncharacterized membrane protein